MRACQALEHGVTFVMRANTSMSPKLSSNKFRSHLMKYLESFVRNSNSGDQITLSKEADIELSTGLRLLKKSDSFIVLEGESTLVRLTPKQANAHVIYSIAFEWSMETGKELRTTWQ